MSAITSSSSATPAISRKGRYNFPPGPELNLLWYAFRKFHPENPLRLFQYLRETYGDIAHYKIGPEHFVLLNQPEYIREVLVVQHDKFIKERTVQRSKMLLGQGMLTAEGGAHRRQRQAAQPAFHRRQITVYAQTMVEHAAAMRECWHDGAQFDVSLEMIRLTLRIVARTLFGTDIENEVAELADAINQIMRMYSFLVIMPAAETLVSLPLPGVRRFTKARDRLDRTVYRMIDEHRAGQKQGHLLSMMLEDENGEPQSDSALRDQVITIFLAGYETTANALTWTWYLLSQNPEAERRMHEEIDGVLGGRMATLDDLPNLRYTEMVLAESMRLFPPAWTMGRKAVADLQLGPYYLPAGTTMLMSQWVMHRDAIYFPDPMRFDPERFSPEAKAARPKLVYFPFGAGPRQCIGESFAWMEGVLVLATIAQCWRLRLAAGQRVEPQPLITLRPKFGMRMHAERRESSVRLHVA